MNDTLKIAFDESKGLVIQEISTSKSQKTAVVGIRGLAKAEELLNQIDNPLNLSLKAIWSQRPLMSAQDFQELVNLSKAALNAVVNLKNKVTTTKPIPTHVTKLCK